MNPLKTSSRSSAGLSNSKLSLGVGFAFFCAATAFMPVESVQAQGEDTVGEIEEIIVTARKREESLQDSPVVISALSSETISDFGITSIEDIADFIPGLVADAQGGSAGGLLYLRGIGSGTSSSTIDQAISLVVDDMQVGTLQLQNSAMIDMESVQVYKGPQALFFGKNSPGGVLSIRTADPGDEFEAGIKTGYEFEREEWFVQGVVSGPMSDTAAGRLVVRYTELDGLFDVETSPHEDVYGGKLGAGENLFVRGTLLLDPSDDLSIRAKLTYNDTDNETSGTTHLQRVACPLGAPQLEFFGAYPCKADDTHFLAPIPQGTVDAFATEGISIDRAGAWENEQLLATVSIEYDISDTLTLSSVTGYYAMEGVGSGAAFGLLPAPAVASSDLDFDQFTQEFRLTSDYDGTFNFVAGLFYEDKTHDYLQPVWFSFSPVMRINEYDQDTTAMSVFVDLIWNLSDNLELSVGARYSDEEKEITGIRGYSGDLNPTEEWDDLSPQVTLTWHASDEWMLFASYREGFKSGGFDGSSGGVSDISFYEPEEVEGFEVGAKGTLLDSTFQLNLAAFSYEYDELQLSSFDSETLNLGIVNAAGADLQGIEADFIWLTPVEGLQARGSVAVLDSEFTDYLAPCYVGQSPAAGCNQSFPGSTGNDAYDLSGEKLNHAADFVAALGLVYQQQLGSLMFSLSFDATYSDDYEAGSSRIPGTTQDSYTRLNAAISLASLDDTWSATLIGRNLTNEYTITTGTNQPGTGSNTGTAAAVPADAAAYVRPGLTVALEVGFKF